MTTLISLFAMGTEDFQKWLKKQGACPKWRRRVKANGLTAWQMICGEWTASEGAVMLAFIIFNPDFDFSRNLKDDFERNLAIFGQRSEVVAYIPSLPGTAIITALKAFLTAQIEHDYLRAMYTIAREILQTIPDMDLLDPLVEYLWECADEALAKAESEVYKWLKAYSTLQLKTAREERGEPIEDVEQDDYLPF